MSPTRPPSSEAERGARAVHRAFELYQRRFHRITHGARAHFLNRDWKAARRDALRRLDLYPRIVEHLVEGAHRAMGERVRDRSVWTRMRAAYAGLIAGRPDVELAETFFNSFSRQIFDTVGVDTQIEFVRREKAKPFGGVSVYKTFPARGSLRELVRQVLDHPAYPYEDVERCAELVTAAIGRAFSARGRQPVLEAIEIIDKGFYRGRSAYMVGRILLEGDRLMPLVLALVHGPEGVRVDAVLLTEDEVSILFSFTRSYFRVGIDHVGKVIEFLMALMPRKPVAELYNSLGYNKHGKTELYRDLLKHLARTSERFEIAPGDRGMVMIVFAMPGHGLVFKVIRDRFAYPKTATRAHVKQRYQLVFRHDRAGRLIDAQEFEHLEFDRARFSDELLEELAAEAAGSVRIDAETVAFDHVYTERRLVPLNLYLRAATPEQARRAVVEYGRAIRDLAVTNIFPGDLLLKNFGVTRHGRVIFYDYDELSLLTECRFRDLPPPSDSDDEMRGEPWFYVDERDIFPEEFLQFLGMTPEQREWFLAEHADLLTARYWRDLQERHRAGEVLDVAPYPPSKRLPRG
ncbi:MAG: bifunctional isocitrate dehydrogenase kinase/phosphatase [Planctomycetes bacterium]|nr:bifunctional isocitrate dehydrogenase kinase/phosphatase [Planctomycetota bacterium]